MAALPLGTAHAIPDQPAQAEIDHLLDFVGASNCRFERNGSTYDASAARSHLVMKYRFARFRLSTADEFVKYLASGSSESGQPYRVECDGKEQLAGDWLTSELRRYRSVQHAAR